MNLPSRARATAVATLLVLSSLPGFAAQPPVAPDPDGDVVTLSPFVISGADDNGYSPAETLSGTRLRTSVRDVASAMTIITPEFMNDIGAFNYADIVNFMPSTASYATNEGDTNGNGVRTGTPFIVRGYRSDSLSADFFSSMTPADAYNTSRMTFTRGPNSILFGIGNPGGALDITTNKATLNRSFDKLDLRFDSYGGMRFALDSNLPVKRDRAALRFDLLHDDRGNNIKPSKNRRDSLYATLTVKPTKNGILYAEFETTHLRQKLPRSFEAFDWYNPWLNAGQPVVATARNTKALNGVEFLASNGYPVYIPGVGAMDWSKMAYGVRPTIRGIKTTATSSTSFGVGSPHRVVPLDRYIAGDSDRVSFDDDNYTVIYQQQLAPGWYLELGAKHDHSYRENMDGNGMGFAIQVDPNAQLPNGQPNPYLGVPYTEQAPKIEKGGADDDQLRATLSYEKDLRDIKLFNRGLGRFTVAGLYNNEANHSHLETYLEVNETPLPGSTSDLGDARNSIRRRWYFAQGRETYFVSDYAPINENGVKSGWEPTKVPRNNFTRTGSYVIAAQANLLDDLIAVSGGLRRDEVTILQSNYVKDARGLYSEGPWGGTRAPTLTGTGRPYLVGVVLNVHPNVALFYNESTNYLAVNQSSRTLTNDLLPPVTGFGFDTGAKFFIWHDRLTGSFDYFETDQRNITDTTIRGSKTGWMNAIWDAIDPTQKVDTAWADVRQQKTRGLEFQLVANVNESLRLMANVSRNTNVLEDQGHYTFLYLAANYPTWLAHATTPVVSPDGKTVGDLVARIQQSESDDHQIIGIRQTRVFEWQANLVARYQLDHVIPWKGFAVGTAIRWRNAPVIGFARNGSVLDPTRPFYSKASTNVDAWVEYGRNIKLGSHKVRWVAQVRVQNVWDDRTLLPWTADDDGTGTAIILARRTPGERQFSFSSTFSF